MLVMVVAGKMIYERHLRINDNTCKTFRKSNDDVGAGGSKIYHEKMMRIHDGRSRVERLSGGKRLLEQSRGTRDYGASSTWQI